MNYKYALIFMSLLCAFVNAMEVGEDEPTDVGEERIESEIFKTSTPESLSNLVAQFLAKKLMNDIRSELNSDKTNSKEESYKKYLESNPLTTAAQKLILKELIKKESNLLWKTLPQEAVEQNLDINLRDIIALYDNKLLVLYDEQFDDQNSNKVSKIIIWDMKSQDWVNTDIQLPEVHIFNRLISKDLKTLFLWCAGCFILVYDLTENNEVSRIPEGPHVINCVCLLNADQWICCGLGNGSVKIFDKDTAEEVFSFKAADNQEIKLIEGMDDVIVTADASTHIRSWKLTSGEKFGYKCNEISNLDHHYGIFGVRNLKLGFNGKRIIIYFSFFDDESVKLFTFPDFKLLKDYYFSPGELGFKASLDSNLFISSYEKRAFWTNRLLNEFKILQLLDAESGEIIGIFRLEGLLANDGSPIKWQSFVVSSDNSSIVLYDKKGSIAKISLNLDEGLESTLSKIKLHLEDKKSILKSLCWIS